jgi:hypothetical protein
MSMAAAKGVYPWPSVTGSGRHVDRQDPMTDDEARKVEGYARFGLGEKKGLTMRYDADHAPDPEVRGRRFAAPRTPKQKARQRKRALR